MSTTTEVATRNDQQISPWGAFANETQSSAIAGDLLKFVKGRWYRGEERKLLPAGTRIVANMAELWTGWVRWQDSRPVEYRIDRLVDFPRRVQREELGHDDTGQWEVDPQGKPKDPWQPTDRLIMRDGANNLLTFTTSSYGGRSALGKLCRAFDKDYRSHSGKCPTVELGVETFEHSAYGPIDKPSFKIVGWVPWDGDSKPRLEVTADDPRTLMKDDLDDEIPF